jgi:hypothetical protein
VLVLISSMIVFGFCKKRGGTASITFIGVKSLCMTFRLVLIHSTLLARL